jgi:nicotinamide riboside transporter PnuC
MENQFQPGYGSQQVQQPLPNATAVLVLGIVSIVGCFCYGIVGTICGIIALVLASKDNAKYRANPEAYTPGSLKNLNAGRVCAIIGLILSLLYIALVIFGISFLGMEALRHPENFMKR